MLMGLSNAPISEAQATARALVFAEALADVPTWAVVEARKAWLRGDREHFGEDANFAFPPSPGQLASAARSIRSQMLGEALRLRRLQAATVQEQMPANPEMIRRIAKLVGGRS